MITIVDKILKRHELPQVAQNLLEVIKNKSNHSEWKIGVHGALGTGKTTLFQEFLLALTEQDPGLKNMPAEAQGQSPTYTYLKTYEGEHYSIWHVDAYRLAQKIWEEIFATWQEDTSNRTHVLWVEWFDRVEAPPPDMVVSLNFRNQEDTRHIKIETLS
jgi:tRNA threonylcarbamoyl adenosine modification protein YjeE